MRTQLISTPLLEAFSDLMLPYRRRHMCFLRRLFRTFVQHFFRLTRRVAQSLCGAAETFVFTAESIACGRGAVGLTSVLDRWQFCSMYRVSQKSKAVK